MFNSFKSGDSCWTSPTQTHLLLACLWNTFVWFDYEFNTLLRVWSAWQWMWVSVQVCLTLRKSVRFSSAFPSPCSASEGQNTHCSQVFSEAVGTKSFSFSCCVLGFDLSNLLPVSLTARLDPHSPRHSTCPEQALGKHWANPEQTRNLRPTLYQALCAIKLLLVED